MIVVLVLIVLILSLYLYSGYRAIGKRQALTEDINEAWAKPLDNYRDINLIASYHHYLKPKARYPIQSRLISTWKVFFIMPTEQALKSVSNVYIINCARRKPMLKICKSWTS